MAQIGLLNSQPKVRKKMKSRNAAFTLLEILVVVIVLGILAMIVIPKFTAAADSAKAARMASDLRTIRQQLELYRLEHRGNFPTLLATDTRQLTQTTNDDGTIAPAGKSGPYLQVMPANPFNDKATVEVEDGIADKGDGSHGWHFDMSTGCFDSDTPEYVSR